MQSLQSVNVLSFIQDSHAYWKVLESPGIISLKIPGAGKSWKLSLVLKVLEIKLNVLGSPGIYLWKLWFRLTERPPLLPNIM